MEKSTHINVRTNPHLKEKAEEVYGHFGISLSQAINTFLVKSVDVGGFPFDIRQEIPNEVTMAAFRELEDMKAGKIPKDETTVDELFAELGDSDA